jgi:outer membrane receptor protein involved in Fe transport
VGLSDGGSINNLHNIDYHHQVYAFYGQDDWRVTPKLTLNLGLRYELFTTIKERNNELGTFDLSTGSLIVPKGVNAQLTILHRESAWHTRQPTKWWYALGTGFSTAVTKLGRIPIPAWGLIRRSS